VETAPEKLSTFPVFLKVAGRKIVVVGNGEAAFAKLRLLQKSNATLVAVADSPHPPLRQFLQQEQQKEGGVSWINQTFSPHMLQDAVLVFAAFEHMAANKTVMVAARTYHIPLNVVDEPDFCDFYTPTLINRAPVAVAIGSQGAAPVLTQAIRARVEALLPQNLGVLARFAASMRDEIDKTLPRGRVRRWFWQRFFSASMARFVSSGNLLDAKAQVRHLVAASQTQIAGQIVFVEVAKIQLNVLQDILLLADHIVVDASVADFFINQGRRDAYRYHVAERAEDNADLIVSLWQKNQMVVRLGNDTRLMVREMDLLAHRNVGYGQMPICARSHVPHVDMAA